MILLDSVRRVIFDLNCMFVVRKKNWQHIRMNIFRILIASFEVILRRSVRGILHAWTAHEVNDEHKKTRVLIKVEKIKVYVNSAKIDKFLSWFNCSSHQLAPPAGFRSPSDLRVRGSWRWQNPVPPSLKHPAVAPCAPSATRPHRHLKQKGASQVQKKFDTFQRHVNTDTKK